MGVSVCIYLALSLLPAIECNGAAFVTGVGARHGNWQTETVVMLRDRLAPVNVEASRDVSLPFCGVCDSWRLHAHVERRIQSQVLHLDLDCFGVC